MALQSLPRKVATHAIQANNSIKTYKILPRCLEIKLSLLISYLFHLLPLVPQRFRLARIDLLDNLECLSKQCALVVFVDSIIALFLLGLILGREEIVFAFAVFKEQFHRYTWGPAWLVNGYILHHL